MSALSQGRRLASEAAEWLTRLETDESRDCLSAFYDWLCESPAHIRSYLEMTEMTVQLQSAKKESTADWDALRADVSSKVLPWREQTSGALSDERGEHTITTNAAMPRPRRARWFWTAAAAALVACLGILLLHAPTWVGDRTFATDIGEQRTIKLDDGSVVTLNTRSRLSVHLSKTERRIRLLDGEALFTVAHDASRPFRVVTDSLSIRAIGTQFDVHRRAAGTTVSVIEGRVQVERIAQNQSAAEIALLQAGEEARVERDRPIRKGPIADTAAPVAWRTRRLIFHETPLEEMADEFNRYNRVQIEVEGEFGDNERFTGGFDADNLPALIRFLERDAALVVTQEKDRVRVRKRAD
jgi:transmembrane sensor